MASQSGTGEASTPVELSVTNISETETTGSQVEGLEAKQKVSDVWQHFEKKFLPGMKKFDHSVCRYCKNTKYKHTTATGTLWAHLRRCFRYPYNDSNKRQKTLEVSKEQGESRLSVWKFDQDECRKALTRMIIVDELPFNFVEHQGFRNFCEVVQPRLKLVGRVTIAKDCLIMFAELKKDLKSKLLFNARRVCLTTDTWSSLQNCSYMVLTAHFVDAEWKLCKRILNFCSVLSHKGVAIGNAIESCMQEWGISQVLTLTVDNASSNDTAVAHLKRKLNKKQAFVLNGEFFHVRCCAHILNLVVKDGLREEKSTIDKIRMVIKFIRGSPQRIDTFRKCCELENCSSKSNLVLDVPTRWNYTYLMLETALKYRKSIERFGDLDCNFHGELKDDVPSDDDWDKAKTFCMFLKTFYDVTKRLSGSLYVTANSYFHDVLFIQSTIKTWANSSDIMLQTMAKSMKAKFDKYWGDLSKVNMMLLIAVVLDPRFKLFYVRFCYEEIYCKEEVEVMVNSVKDAMSRLYDYYQMLDSSSQPSNVDGFSSEEEVDCMVVEDFREKYFRRARKENIVSKTEWERYEEDVFDKKESKNFNVLVWWKVNSSRFPILSMMARDVLAIPVTTVASESAFSTGGRVLDQFRSSLSPKVAEALICAGDWLRAEPLPIELDKKLDEMSDIESTITEDPELAAMFTNAFV